MLSNMQIGEYLHIFHHQVSHNDDNILEFTLRFGYFENIGKLLLTFFRLISSRILNNFQEQILQSSHNLLK